MVHRFPSMILASLLMASAVPAFADEKEKAKVDFARDVRPILSNRCFSCHGPDARARKARLRLDTEEGAYGKGSSGERAVVPGKLDESELYQRIVAGDTGEIMPPPKAGKPLTASEIETIQNWIEQGAKYEKKHWSFFPPSRPSVPGTGDPSWIKTPIDAFIQRLLDIEKLKPSPEANRTTLIRRLSLDLIGLPPTIAEVDAFLADTSDRAYEKLVDRLLSSPHYGERWGRLWLDAARYADSDGYEKDKPRQVWPYRDWVINALNRDLPYSDFVIDQIAGDLRPNASQDQIVATGFLRNSMVNEEGGIDPEQFRMEAMFDRMDALGKAVLGLTIQCAQCHTHKYDPLTQTEYYRMFAFLNDTHEANVAVYSPEQQRARSDLFRQIHAIEDDLKHKTPDWSERMAQWEKSLAKPGEWTVLQPVVDDISNGGQKYLPMRDGSFLAQGYAPTKHRVKMTVRTDLKDISAFRLELMNDPDLPLGGPGRSITGTCALTEFAVEAAPSDAPGKVTKIKIVSATANVNPPEAHLASIFDDKSKRKRVTGPIAFAIDGKDETAWGIDVGPGRRNVPRKAVFQAEKPVSFPAGTILTFYLQQNHGGWNSDDNQTNNLGRMRLSITNDAKAEADPLPASVLESLAVSPDRRTPAQTSAIFHYWRTTVPEWRESNDRIEALWKGHPEGATQLVLQSRDDSPRMTHLLQRGDFLKPAQPVAPGVPAFLNPLPKGSSADRLTFASWLVARDSPTTARALVNRVWQAYFGTGLVSTSEDLGSQCDAPSHPELLDWLAVEFVEHGWSQKALHRLIVTSSVYRQSSKVAPELLAKDPFNRLLARGPRFRVDAEVVRDIALAASGLLDPKVGGPSVYPPAPSFLFQPPASYGPKVWDESKGLGAEPASDFHVPLSLDPASRSPDVRRPQRRLRLRSPLALEYAAPGPCHPERARVSRLCPRPGDDDAPRGSRLGRRPS